MSYASMILADAPLAYWRLGETSGSTAADSSPGGHHAAYAGAPTLNQPALIAAGDAATLFDGAAARVNCGHPASFSFGAADFALELWCRPDAIDARRQQLAAKDSATGREYWLEINSAGPGSLRAFVFDADGSAYAAFDSAAAVLTQGQTYHLFLQRSGPILQLFVNGSAVPLTSIGASTTLPTMVPSDTDLCLGMRQYAGTEDYFTGLLDEVALYAAALPPWKVRSHYLLGRGKFSPPDPLLRAAYAQPGA